jgi:hypothetical protein
MSKELPYFKFEPSSWDNGNIQVCSKSVKGLFIDICSMYWVRLGELPYALALQKHCNGNASDMQELIDHDIIIVKDGNIIIEFLDEQLTDFIQVSEKRKVAANKRWDANAMQKQCKSNAIRGEERREEKKKVDNRFIPPTIEEIKSRMVERKLSLFTAEAFHAHYTTNGWMVGKNKMKDWDSALTTWNEKAKQYESSAGNSRRDNKRTNKLWN